jgi:hypothetical protein
MTNVDDIFSRYYFSEKAETPLKGFSNWILGISFGICSLLIFKTKELNLSNPVILKTIYISIVVISMANLLLSGYVKYLLLKRDVSMGVIFSELKKIELFYNPDNTNQQKKKETEEKKDTLATSWASQFNKIGLIGKLFNVSLLTTLITTIATGILLLITIL